GTKGLRDYPLFLCSLVPKCPRVTFGRAKACAVRGGGCARVHCRRREFAKVRQGGAWSEVSAQRRLRHRRAARARRSFAAWHGADPVAQHQREAHARASVSSLLERVAQRGV